MDFPRYGHPPIQMRRLPDVTDEVEDSWPWQAIPDEPGGPVRNARTKYNPHFPQARGEFFWNLTHGERTLVVALPRGPGEPADDDFAVTEWPITFPLSNGSQWTWDGDADAPTLKPSLGAPGIWHGWVTAGHLCEV